MRCCMIECAQSEQTGSIGAHYVAEAARSAGATVDVLAADSARTGYDVELVSVHHCTDFERLAALPKRGRVRLVGGHAMANNPRAAIPFADAVCIGEGESWTRWAIRVLADYKLDVGALAEFPGTIISAAWQRGDVVPEPRAERPLPDHPPYLNWADRHSAAWYIEIARGCPHGCHYCELGHSMPYRSRPADQIIAALDACDRSQSSRLSFFAPDEASHPRYAELCDAARERGLHQAFGSYRIDQVLARDLHFPASLLVRVGLDGLSQETRARVAKPITDAMVVEYFERLLREGHTNYKIFMIIGYPWERCEDFGAWERLMRAVMALPLTRSVHLRVKWTPLIPQPCTPLADAEAQYDQDLVRAIHHWHAAHRKPQSAPGWYVECDGLMSAETHTRQIALTRATEGAVARRGDGWIHPAWKGVA